ncbi:hypothetical protein [Cellulomonas rhizosphaerae]|uniref:Uncharacterized protein n=1 Tax=Cellulomonas rhizosphaerae TaxID=2293719 RepID=A0A413RJF3_9CELL|nr:hypothetical protein [Cellulomonas rhizosphaerae]RHA38710.1 hypothetical protein D1825_13330 [Cellulomonas rhizosphaerae]
MPDDQLVRLGPAQTRAELEHVEPTAEDLAYTPDTDAVLTNYVVAMRINGRPGIDPHRAFRRWLAKHDAEVAAKALRDAAAYAGGGPYWFGTSDREFLRERADRIERGDT